MPKLAFCASDSLFAELYDLSQSQKITHHLPTRPELGAWIAAAKASAKTRPSLIACRRPEVVFAVSEWALRASATMPHRRLSLGMYPFVDEAIAAFPRTCVDRVHRTAIPAARVRKCHHCGADLIGHVFCESASKVVSLMIATPPASRHCDVPEVLRCHSSRICSLAEATTHCW